MQSGSSDEVRSVVGATDTRGKHRISAELKRLEQEIRFLEEELEQLEKMDNASAACKEMLINIETRPDPLLPQTTGPINPVWDRWFKGHKSRRVAGAGYYDSFAVNFSYFWLNVFHECKSSIVQETSRTS